MTNKEKIQKIREIGEACVVRLRALHQKQLAIIRGALQKSDATSVARLREKLQKGKE